MTSFEGVKSDYFDFHRDKLNTLLVCAEGLIDSVYESIIVEQSGGGSHGQIDEGELTDKKGSDFEDNDSNIAIEEDITRLNREVQIKTAQISFIELQAKASMRFIAQQAQLGLLNEANPPSLLAYSHAEKHVIYPEELEVSIIKLHDVDHLGEIAEYDFKLEDGPIRHCLNLELINDQIVDIKSSTIPIEDEDYFRWANILGPEAIGDLFLVLAGRFDDELELNYAIGEVWQKFIGTSQEEIIVPLLEEIRIRSLAAKAAINLAGQLSTTLSLPSADTLEEWEQILSRL